MSKYIFCSILLFYVTCGVAQDKAIVVNSLPTSNFLDNTIYEFTYQNHKCIFVDGWYKGGLSCWEIKK